jgi:hypothetical protein
MRNRVKRSPNSGQNRTGPFAGDPEPPSPSIRPNRAQIHHLECTDAFVVPSPSSLARCRPNPSPEYEVGPSPARRRRGKGAPVTSSAGLCARSSLAVRSRDGWMRLDRDSLCCEPWDRDPRAWNRRYRFGLDVLLKSPCPFRK